MIVRSALIGTACLAASLTSSGGLAKKPSAYGLYSNVRWSPETGDLGGVEIDVRGDVSQPYVEFVLCEGWCNRPVRVPIQIEGNSFAFDYVERWTDQDGNPTAPTVTRVEGRFVRGGLMLEGQGHGGFGPWKLKRRKLRYGLDVVQAGANP